ncbi:subtilisin-like protein [Thozetella sp. PMI_491]|nr:subtilisin-like protein [Thozetella sp. PMI_491]
MATPQLLRRQGASLWLLLALGLLLCHHLAAAEARGGQGACPNGITCPSGEVCIEFEGTYGCVPLGSSCHGNCYSNGATCCDNDAVKYLSEWLVSFTRAVLKLHCQALNDKQLRPNQHVDTHDVIICCHHCKQHFDSDDDFVICCHHCKQHFDSDDDFVICYQHREQHLGSHDNVIIFSWVYLELFAVEHHVSDNDSCAHADHSQSGMTVEKCVALADTWQYAGVEYGGECFWGDVPFNAEASNQADCNQPCDGNPSQICGAGNRIQLYLDTEWSLLERPELASLMQQYADALAELRALIKQWQDLVLRYQDLLNQQQAAKFKRDDTEILQVFREILDTYDAIMRRKGQYEDLVRSIRKLFEIAMPRGKARQTEVQQLELQIINPVAEQLTQISTAVVTEGSVGAAPAVAETAAMTQLEVVGVAEVAGTTVATGIFVVVASLIASLLDSGGGEGPGQGPTATIPRPSTTSTSTTSSCRATSTADSYEWIVMTDFDTSSSQFKDIVADFKNKGAEIKRTVEYDSINYRFFAATLNSCHADLLKNPRIIGSLPDADLARDDPQIDATNLKREVHVSDMSDLKRGAEEGRSNRTIAARVADDIYVQTNADGVSPLAAPFHLQFLTEAWAKPRTPGLNYGFHGYLFKQDPSQRAPVTVYVLDSGIDDAHIASLSTEKLQDIDFHRDALQFPRPGVVEHRAFFPNTNTVPSSNHGTAMASYIMGAYSGVDNIKNPSFNSQQAMLDAVGAAKVDYIAEKKAGLAKYAIINMSSESKNLATDPGPLPVSDPWPELLNELAAEDIIVIHSAGNFAANNLGDLTPPMHSASVPRLIVVGLSNSKDLRVPQQTTEGTSDGLTVYAYAHHAPAAEYNTAKSYILLTGTSGAAAIVSGVVSIMLATGGTPASVKSDLQRISFSRKSGIPSVKHPEGVPIVAMDLEVGCFVTNPTSPEISKPVINTKADIPIPPPGLPDSVTLGDSVNNVLGRIGFTIPCEKWPET